jgi:hypothetical protein
VTADPRPVAGTLPALPWFLKSCPLVAGTIPAERLAAFRIGVALALVLDIGWTFLPHAARLFALSPPGMFDAQFRYPHAYWSLLRMQPVDVSLLAVFAIWLLSALALLIGRYPHLAGLVAWACSVSVWSANPFFNNSGDLVRNVTLLLVAVAHTGAAWGVSAPKGKWSVPAWPVAVIYVQLSCIYFVSGVLKFLSPAWRSGDVMWNVCHDLNWSLIPGLANHVPMAVYRLSAWTTLWWELGFPLLILYPFTRKLALWLGVFFHVGTAATLEVGMFPWWTLCLYLPLVPWERIGRGQPPAAVETAETSAST